MNTTVLSRRGQMRCSSSCRRSRVRASSAPNGSSISMQRRARWRARGRSGSAAACRPRARRAAVGEVGKPDESELLVGDRASLGLGHLAHAGPELDVAAHRQPRVQVRLLEDDATVRCRAVDPVAADEHLPRSSARGTRRSACSSVVLPQPDGPTTQTNSPGSTVRSMVSSASTAVRPRRRRVRRHAARCRARGRRRHGRHRPRRGHPARVRVSSPLSHRPSRRTSRRRRRCRRPRAGPRRSRRAPC